MQQPPGCKRPSKGKEVCFIVSDSLWPHEPVAHQVSPSMGFSRQEYWSGLPFPSPGDLPNPGIKTESGIWHQNKTGISCFDRQILYHKVMWEAPKRMQKTLPSQEPEAVLTKDNSWESWQHSKGPQNSAFLSAHILGPLPPDSCQI